MSGRKKIELVRTAEIESWIGKFANETTRYQYRSHLVLYFHHFLKTEPTIYIKNKTEKEIKRDIEKYSAYMQNKYNGKSIPPQLSVIRQFLEEEYDIEFKNKFWKNLKERGISNEPVREDRAPEIKELQKILSHCKDVLERAFYLTMSSSGMRPNELCNIRLGNVFLDEKPVRIKIPANISKNKKKRTTFMSDESKLVVIEWLKIRDKFIKRKISKGKGLEEYIKKTYDKQIYGNEADRLFPISTKSMREKWNQLLRHSGFNDKDEATGDYVLHLYTLRKYFETRLVKIVPESYVKYMMGHSGYLNNVYTKFNNAEMQKELSQEYLKGMHRLNIFEIPPNQDDIDLMQGQITTLKSQMDSILRNFPMYKQNYIVDGEEIPVSFEKLLKDYHDDVEIKGIYNESKDLGEDIAMEMVRKHLLKRSKS